MSKFIKLPIVNQTNIEADMEIHMRADDIIEVRVANGLDKKHRHEVESIIVLRNGAGHASSLEADKIIELIEETSL